MYAKHPLRREGLPAGGGGRGGHLCHGRAHRRHGHLHRSPPVSPHISPTWWPPCLYPQTCAAQLEFFQQDDATPLFTNCNFKEACSHMYSSCTCNMRQALALGMCFCLACRMGVCVFGQVVPQSPHVFTPAALILSTFKSPARLGIFVCGRSAAVHEDACSPLHLLHACCTAGYQCVTGELTLCTLSAGSLVNGPKQRNYLLTADHCFVGAYMPSLVYSVYSQVIKLYCSKGLPFS